MNRITIHPLKIAIKIGYLALLVIILSTIFQIVQYLTDGNKLYGIVSLFWLDSEYNIPAFFSTVLILIASLLLGAIAYLKSQTKDSFSWAWSYICCLFGVMAADEAIGFHEQLVRPMRIILQGHKLGLFYYAWVIPAIIFLCFLALFFRKFLVRLPAQTKKHFLLAAFVFIAGAVGCEMIAGWYDELQGINTLLNKILVTIEESLEMTGMIIFIYGLLEYIQNVYPVIELQSSQLKTDHDLSQFNTSKIL
jgi:hypothetical protein